MTAAFSTDRMKVFFAYKRGEDEPYRSMLDKVYVELRNQGFEVYRDEESIELGSYWRPALAAAIAQADIGIVNWTPKAPQSMEVLAEAEELEKLKKYCGVFHYEMSPPPPELYKLRSIQSVSLTGWNGDLQDLRWRKLVAHLERLAARIKNPDGQSTSQLNPDGTNLQEDMRFPVLRRARTPGDFTLGATSSGSPISAFNWGQSEVRLRHAFAISKHPISNREWRAAIEGGASLGSFRVSAVELEAPKTGVTFLQAQAYVAWLNYEVAGVYYRLPSEAEWEYAKRTGLIEHREPPIREWVADTFSLTLDGAAIDGRARRDLKAIYRAVRGGAFGSGDAEQELLTRTGYGLDFESDDLGFRVVRDL